MAGGMDVSHVIVVRCEGPIPRPECPLHMCVCVGRCVCVGVYVLRSVIRFNITQ